MRTRRPVDFPTLRSLIHPRQALELIGWRAVWTRGPTLLRGPCPIHGSQPDSRSLAVSDRVVYCHKCHWTGDAVAIWAWHQGMDALDAAIDLCQRLHVHVPYL